MRNSQMTNLSSEGARDIRAGDLSVAALLLCAVGHPAHLEQILPRSSARGI